jgi:hypothetical protein
VLVLVLVLAAADGWPADEDATRTHISTGRRRTHTVHTWGRIAAMLNVLSACRAACTDLPPSFPMRLKCA